MAFAPGIRVRIPLILLAAGAVFGWVSYEIHLTTERNQSLTVGAAHAEGSAEGCVDALEDPDDDGPVPRAQVLQDALEESPGILAVTIVDPAGRIVAAAPDSLRGRPLDAVLGAGWHERRIALRSSARSQAQALPSGLLIAESPVRRGPFDGMRLVWIADQSRRIAALERQIGGETATSGLVGLVIVALVALFLDRWIRVPAQRLAATAERIAAGDLTARTGLEGTDELARAAQAFDRMAEQLEAHERELTSARRIMETVLQAMPIGVTVLRRDDLSIVFANSQWRALYAPSAQPGDLARRHVEAVRLERVDGTPYPFDELATLRVLRSGRPERVADVVFVAPEGTRIPTIVHAAPVSLFGAVDYDAVISVVQDQRELVRLSEELQLWQNRFEKVAAATGQVVYEWDMTTNDMSRSGGRSNGPGFDLSSGPEAIEHWRSRLHPDDRDRASAELDACVRSGRPYDCEYRLRHADGQWRTIHDRGFFDRDDTGTPVRMYGTMADITAQRELEAQLRQAQKMETVGTLAGGIAHDFNNQLTGVIGHLDLIDQTLAEADPRREHVQIARVAARRCADLTRGLLAFSRRLASHPQSASLNDLVEESVQLLRRALPTSIRVETTLAPGLPPVLVDVVQLQQVLVNLCVNARDAMPDGGRLRIETHLIELGAAVGGHDPAALPRWAELSVRDDGTGIAAEILPRLFEPFFTTKPVGQGTGLGLAMVYGIVTQHGGHIEVDSEPGRGACFRVRLPLADHAPAKSAPDPAHASQTGRGETVLVVDDEPIVRELAMRTLAAAGYDVLGAGDGNEALRVLAGDEARIAIVLLDFVMPGRSGIEVLEAMRALAIDVPVVFMSGYAGGDTLDLHDAAGFLAKPFSPADLVRLVHDALTPTAPPAGPRDVAV